LPGAALALILTEEALAPELVHLLFGVVSTCLIASANYTINEWWDAAFDRHHPVKRFRPSAAGRVSAAAVYAPVGAAGGGRADHRRGALDELPAVLRPAPDDGAGLQRQAVADQGPPVPRRAVGSGQQPAALPARLERDRRRRPAAVQHPARLLDRGRPT
jgi:hypothetical protein